MSGNKAGIVVSFEVDVSEERYKEIAGLILNIRDVAGVAPVMVDKATEIAYAVKAKSAVVGMLSNILDEVAGINLFDPSVSLGLERGISEKDWTD